MTIYTHIFVLEVPVNDEGDTDEYEVRLTCEFSPGHPETPPAYDHGGLPADPPELDLLGVEAKVGEVWTKLDPKEYLHYRAESYLDDHYDDIVAAAAEDRKGQLEYARELAAESRRGER